MLNTFEQSGFVGNLTGGERGGEGCTDIEEGLPQDDGDPAVATGDRRGRKTGGHVEPASKREQARLQASRSTRAMSLATMAKEYIWLWDVRHGISTNEIATREGVSVRRVRFGVARARAQEKPAQPKRPFACPRLIPLFPIGPYTPQSACGHNRPIEAGSIFCCMVCHRSGVDDHPGSCATRSPTQLPSPSPLPLRRRHREKLENSGDSASSDAILDGGCLIGTSSIA